MRVPRSLFPDTGKPLRGLPGVRGPTVRIIRLMPLQVGPFSISGTPAQIAAIAPMAQKVADVLGNRISNVQVNFLPGAKMPKRPDGGPSVGYTPTAHLIKMWAAIRQYKVAETFGHEALHLLGYSKAQKDAIIGLATPSGGQWNAPGYPDDVRETAARCGSRALFGIAVPPYKSFYSHDITPSKDALLKAALLGTPVVVEPDPPPQPTPADPVALQAQIDALEAEVAEYFANWQAADAKAGVFATRLSRIATDLDGLIPSLAAIANRARQ